LSLQISGGALNTRLHKGRESLKNDPYNRPALDTSLNGGFAIENCVVPGISVASIRSGPSIEVIVAGAAVKRVSPCVAIYIIGAVISLNFIIAVVSTEEVSSCAPNDTVVTGMGVNVVIPRPPVHVVALGPAQQLVVACVTPHKISPMIARAIVAAKRIAGILAFVRCWGTTDCVIAPPSRPHVVSRRTVVGVISA
jgi:hypothetical protein